MGYTYNVYGTKQVDDARNTYNKIANSSPMYSDSVSTATARQQADKYAQSYNDKINQGYSSEYREKINQLADKYSNNNFSWSTDSSAEYQQMADKYRREGSIAQENTQGNAAANTGGYTNSYSIAAGQKTYGQYMDELANKIPSLRNEAYNSWQEQQESTLNQISVLQGLDDTQYQRYRDSVSDDYDFMTYYENKYASSKGLDMSQFQNELAKWQTQLNAAQNNLSTVKQLAEQQYEHNTLSADAKAEINSQQAQNNAYYNYLYSQIK